VGGVTEARAGQNMFLISNCEQPEAAEHVPLGIGPPTKYELLVHYPPKFTWHQLKTFINSGFVSSQS